MEKFLDYNFIHILNRLVNQFKRQPRVVLVVLVSRFLQTTGWLVLAEHPDQSQPTTVIADTNNRENHHP